MLQNNKMINLRDLIENCFKKNEIYIPLIQRNYKWEKGTVEKLVTDLWQSFNNNSEFTISMITLYREDEKKMQLIDGQQRVITLTLLLKFLDKNNTYFNFSFERDEGISDNLKTRYDFLCQIADIKIEYKDMYTDLIRFKENFDVIKETLEKDVYDDAVKQNFINFILNKVFILFHITDVEPVDEFLNINKNKTRFVISDYIKANLIISENKIDNVYSRENILKLYKELSKHLFVNHDIWNLTEQGYMNKIPSTEEDRNKNLCYPDESRLKILFCDRYDGNSSCGYEAEPEYKKLKHYIEILNLLKGDIEKNNWNSYNGFCCLFKLKNVKFFEMFGKGYDDEILNKSLESVIIEEINKLSSHKKNCFIQSQLVSGKDKLSFILEIKENEFNNKKEWIYTAENNWELFETFYKEYIKEKYQGEKEVLKNV